MTYRYFITLTTGEPISGQVFAESCADAEKMACAEVARYSGRYQVRPAVHYRLLHRQLGRFGLLGRHQLLDMERDSLI